MYPFAFEFSSVFLVDFLDCVLSCRFGNFLCNSEKERQQPGVSEACGCLWSYLSDLRASGGHSHMHYNLFYDSTKHEGPLLPPAAALAPTLWPQFHLRWSCPDEVEAGDMESKFRSMANKLSELHKAKEVAETKTKEIRVAVESLTLELQNEKKLRSSAMSLAKKASKENATIKRAVQSVGCKIHFSSMGETSVDIDSYFREIEREQMYSPASKKESDEGTTQQGEKSDVSVSIAVMANDDAPNDPFSRQYTNENRPPPLLPLVVVWPPVELFCISMAKGDDIRRRKTSKATRKKLQKDPSSVSARVASIIAAKKRRKSSKRSKCQGMCFSLPTPEDPFNDRHGENDANMKHKKKPMPSQANAKIYMNKEGDVQRKRICDSHQGSINHGESKRLKMKNLENDKKLLIDTDKIGKANLARLGNEKLQLFAERQVVVDQKRKSLEKSGCPSKFLMFCLKSINDYLLRDGELNRAQDEPLMADTWGVEFWKRFSVGKDILETSGTSPTLQQIAWVASTAADTIASNEKEGLSFTNPFLLYLVPSQKDAVKVRSVCKPLKALGIHTVSLHPGASMDHQIQGLKSCEPEFVVATPERLWEVVSLKAIDISRVSLLVVDGLASLSKSGLLDVVKCIRQSISRNSQTVVFQGCSSAEAVQSILMGPVHKY